MAQHQYTINEVMLADLVDELTIELLNQGGWVNRAEAERTAEEYLRRAIDIALSQEIGGRVARR